MDKSLRLSQQQKIQQRLAPLQVQFVKMLEMNSIEVEDEVRRAVDENPALEVCDQETPMQQMDEDGDSFNESAEELMTADYRNEDEIPSYRLEANNHSADDEFYIPEAVYSTDSVIETLTSQLSELDIDDQQLKIASYIIGCIDDNGYLSRDLSQICDDLTFSAGLDISPNDVKEVLDIVRSLDPPGIGAIDLRDCLLLQLRRMPDDSETILATTIIEHYFDLFSKMHYDKLRSELNIDQQTLRLAIEQIRSLNPKPGSIISGGAAEERSNHIIPDFNIDVDGERITLTLTSNIPELQIEETFTEKTSESLSQRQQQAQIFIKRKRDEARDFISALKMRQETLYNVMSAIVKIQRKFFLTEDESLIRPMILKDIEAVTGYDLTVISRATATKYVSTPSGVYPLKLFFNERPKDDDDTSYHEIQAVLKEIIDNENKQKPMSDEALTAALKERGYDIARRTVTKYRERMGLPVARLRKTL